MSSKHQCELESDGKSEFVVFNGIRIAKRGEPNTPQARTWEALVPGYRIIEEMGGSQLVIVFEGKPVAAVIVFRPKR
jgi:hypothetical protein